MATLLEEILEELGSQFSSALEGMLGEPWTASVRGKEKPETSGGYFGWRQKLNLHAEPVIEVIAGLTAWSEIGTRALRAAGLESPGPADVRATYLELLTQSLSGLARDLTQKTGRNVQLESGADLSDAQLDGPSRHHAIRLTDPQGIAADLFVLVSPTLLAALQPQAESTTASGSRGELTTLSAAAPLRTESTKMDMLLDVELPVSVSFGRTQLALKDLVKLSTGSIIELNRTITEPVEVIVNNCVVARGEVVVVDGNYGVRIQQILSRSDRLRSVD